MPIHIDKINHVDTYDLSLSGFYELQMLRK